METIRGIYVPGLGDEKSRGQDTAIRGWSGSGILLDYHPIGWGNTKLSYRQKLAGLSEHIDDLYSRYDEKIVLVGSSAGASAVINARVRRPERVRGVALICGKINTHYPLKPEDFTDNPAFEASLEELPRNIKRLSPHELDTTLSAFPYYDRRVPVPDARLEGSHEQRIPMIGHTASIGFALTLGKGPIVDFLMQT